MELLDFVPFLGFIRNDEETIAIMAQAAKVLPKACDILGISLSFSESEDEDENNTAEAMDRSLNSQVPQVQPRPKPKSVVSASGNFTEVAKPPQSRKRCASTSSLGQSSSGASTTATSEAATPAPLPPKKRRIPSISPTSTTYYEDNDIRKKMLDDIEAFNEKIKQLAALEKKKNRLLEKLLSISSSLQPRASGNDENGEENDDDVADFVARISNQNQSENESQIEDNE